MRNLLMLCLILSCSLPIRAQIAPPPAATPADERLEGYEKRKELAKRSIVDSIEFESIGPTVFSGRVVDLDVSPTDPSHFYVGYASGGLWKTENNGISFEPLFDHEMVMTVGDMAVDWE
ncbi:MAG: glycosyl hydrolase, partial [Saprospiraceae bacterium]|nr:glycosyl hydrolase [Saprospiraceae bacterium]